MKHRPIVFIDIETTGGSKETGRITEIGAIRVADGKVTNTFHTLLNPGRRIAWGVRQLTGISDEMVWEAPSFSAIAEDLEDFFAGAIFAAHNVNFDYGYIKDEFKRTGVNFNMDRVCTVKLSRRLYPNEHRHGLDFVIKRMGVIVKNRHRAYDDAEVLLKMFALEYRQRPYELFKLIDKLMTKSNNNRTYISYQTKLL